MSKGKKINVDRIDQEEARDKITDLPYKKFVAQVRLLSDHTWEIVRTEDEFFDY